MPRDDWGRMRSQEHGRKAFLSGEYDRSVKPQKPARRKKQKPKTTYDCSRHIMTIGKYRGMSLSKIETSYLSWFAENITDRPTEVALVRQELELRKQRIKAKKEKRHLKKQRRKTQTSDKTAANRH